MSIIERAINAIAPHICAVCSSEGNPVCNSCQNDIALPLPSSCFLCNTATERFLTCFSCRRKTPLRHVWVVTEYNENTKKIVRHFKYERQRAIAVPIAQMMSDVLPYFDESPLITYVPTATTRVRARGYDHAELIAVELGKRTGYAAVKLLARTGQTRQVGTSRISRRAQITNAYRPIRASRIKGAPMLLVDDITTTGATLTAAAKALRRAGASSVDAIVFARKR